MHNDSTYTATFRHIPTSEETWLYFLDWLKIDPKSLQSNRLFQFLEIQDVNDVRIFDTYGRNHIRANIQMGSSARQGEEYLLDLFFGENEETDCKEDILLAYPQNRRIKLLFDPCEMGDYTQIAVSSNCTYGSERRCGAVALCPFLAQGDHPAHRLFEGSIRWIANEARKEPIEHMGSSAVTLAKFINSHFNATMREAFGRQSSAFAEIIDAETVHVRCVYCQVEDMGEFFDGHPYGVEICGDFDISMSNPAFEIYLSLDYYWMLDDDPIPGETMEAKTHEILEYARKVVKGQSKIKSICIEPVTAYTPFAVCEAYNPVFATEEGRIDFIRYLIEVGRQIANGFSKDNKPQENNENVMWRYLSSCMIDIAKYQKYAGRHQEGVPMNIYLGHDINNQQEIYLPLSEVGNILIAGRCGSGKSVYIHTMLKKLIEKSESFGLVLHDPKRVEFYRLRNDPHLLLPVGKELSDFKNQIAYLEGLFDQRTENDLPIIFIVDEFADVCYNDHDIESQVEHLMEYGPRHGIYMVLATQLQCVYTKKMIDLAGARLSFYQPEADSEQFIGNEASAGLEQGEAILVLKDQPQMRVRVEYLR